MSKKHTAFDVANEVVTALRVLTIGTLRVVFLLMVGICTCTYFMCHREGRDYCQETAPRVCREVNTLSEPGNSYSGRCSCITHDSNWREWRVRPIQ